MQPYFILAGLIFFALLAVLRREYGIYLIVLLLPAYQIRFPLFGLPMTFLECMILILAIISLREISQYRNIAISDTLPIGLFLLAALISVFVSPVRLPAAGIFKAYFFEPALFYFLVRILINTKDKINNLWRALAILALYLSAFGIYQFLTLANLPVSWWSVGVAGRRITSLVNHPNALALLLGPIVAMLIFKKPKMPLHWLAVSGGLVAIYLSLSRAAWLALAATVIGIGLFTEHRKKIMAGAVAILCLVLLVPFSRHKLLDLAGGKDPTQQNRYLLWSAAADILKKSPLTGAGLMGFHERFKDYPVGPDGVVQNYPHNFILTFWVETGLLGLLSFLALLVLFYKKKPADLAVIAGMTVVILHGLVDVPYFKNDLAVLFWLLLALPRLQPN